MQEAKKSSDQLREHSQNEQKQALELRTQPDPTVETTKEKKEPETPNVQTAGMKEKAVYGRDGRKMHPNSLKNIEEGKKDWQPGESGNPNGRPRTPERLFRETMLRVLQGQDEKTRKQKVVSLIDQAYELAKKTENENTFIRVLEMFISSTDGKILNEHQKFNGNTFINKVLVLPTQNSQVQPLQEEEIQPVDRE